MISHIMLTFRCDRCGAEKQRPSSEDDKTPPLPYGWVSYDSSEDGRKRHRCLDCCARIRDSKVPQPILNAVVRWQEAVLAGEDEDTTNSRAGEVFVYAAELVLGRDKLLNLMKHGEPSP